MYKGSALAAVARVRFQPAAPSHATLSYPLQAKMPKIKLYKNMFRKDVSPSLTLPSPRPFAKTGHRLYLLENAHQEVNLKSYQAWFRLGV